MHKTFHILGVSHRVQGEPSVEGSFDDPDYRAIVRQIVSREKIDFVAEEGGDHTTVAEQIANELLGVGHYLNVTPEDRLAFGIGRLCAGAPLSAVAGEMTWNVSAIDKMERIWVQHICDRTNENGLLICGFYHTFSVSTKLLKSGSVTATTHLPHDKLCGHSKS
jgi:hypothetical protein